MPFEGRPPQQITAALRIPRVESEAKGLGMSPCAFQIACTVEDATPTTFAIARNVQWVYDNALRGGKLRRANLLFLTTYIQNGDFLFGKGVIVRIR